MTHDLPTPTPLIVAAFPHPETRHAGLGYSWARARITWPDESASPETRALRIAEAVEFWRTVLRAGVEATAPELLMVLEVMRRWPKVTADSLHALGLGFAKSLANVAYRTGEAVHEDAKEAFASSEIDIALSRFRVAMSELQFSVSSELLSEPTRRIATGKYASGAAMSSRWEALSQETLNRALTYSLESIELGNIQPETISYRIELLLALFDRSGAQEVLEEARRLTREYADVRVGTELAQAEVRLRLVLASDGESRATYLRVGLKLLDEFSPRTGIDAARAAAVRALFEAAAERALAIPPTAASVPNGLASLVAASPSAPVFEVVRRAVATLDELRRRKRSVPAAILGIRLLHPLVEGPADLVSSRDLELYSATAAWLAQHARSDRHLQWEAGAAALTVARRTGNPSLAEKAQRTFESLAARNSDWPLPEIGIAECQDFLLGDARPLEKLGHWERAAVLAIQSPVYRRADLGGRSEVFAVSDARGFLADTFVFKPGEHDRCVYEAGMLVALGKELERLGLTHRFEVPRSLAIVRVEDTPTDNPWWVHVTRRSAGRLVSELPASEVDQHLDAIVELLATFHCVAGSPPEGQSGWKPVKNHIVMWAKSLFGEERAPGFVHELRAALPTGVPLVRKRDAHAANWIIESSGRVVAIDFESSAFIPAGYDVAQLIEDDGLIEATDDGWQRRLELCHRYFDSLSFVTTRDEVEAIYCWSALARALRLGTEATANRRLRRHAREICEQVVRRSNGAMLAAANELQLALAQIESQNVPARPPTHHQRRLSKAMAYMLRHHGPDNGLSVDGQGFALIDDLAALLKVDSADVVAVVEHPREPRFEIREDRVRALYGHSLDVRVESSIQIASPPVYFHGTSWSSLDSIAPHGLTPMGRQMVHLANSVSEALDVGRRKGVPIVLCIDGEHPALAAAEGVWVTRKVPASSLSVVNAYIAEAARFA